MSIYQAADIFWGQQENISLQNGFKGGEIYLDSEQLTASHIKSIWKTPIIFAKNVLQMKVQD